MRPIRSIRTIFGTVRIWPLVGLAGALWTTGASAAPTALGFADGRAGQSLDGAWHVIVDPYDNGLLDYRNLPRRDGYAQDAPPKNKSDLVEYDFARSPTLTVPGDWNTQRPELLYYEGTIWYERRFDAPAASAKGARQFLQFGAAAQRAIVWLNGRRLGAHEGGFTPFAFEVTGQLRPRENSLVVWVNSARLPAAIPATNTDWWNYGGLTRGVRLVEAPAVFVREARVQCARADPRQIAGFVSLDGARGPTPVTIEIPELGARATVQTDAAGRATFAFPARPTLWSPETPKLYDVTIAAGGTGSTIGSASGPSRRWGRRSGSTAARSSCAESRCTKRRSGAAGGRPRAPTRRRCWA